MHHAVARVALALILTGSLLAAAGCSKKTEAPASSTAPDFNLPALGGGTVQLSKLRGKVVLLDFWATYCPPCRAAVPHLSSLQEKFRGRGFMVIGMNLDTDVGELKSFLDQHQVKYAQVHPDEATTAAYRVSPIPRMILIDRKGTVRGDWVGYTPEIKTELEKSLFRLLEEPTTN